MLVLREGWDVRNVTVVLGLRPGTAAARILPEQAVGRGLRLMRQVSTDRRQVLEVLGTPAFENFVRERLSIRRSTADHPVDANYTSHVRIAWVHPADVRPAGRVIADCVVLLKEKGVVSPPVGAEFQIVVQRT